MKRGRRPRALAGPTILDVLGDPEIFGRWFGGPTWAAWRAFLSALFGLPADEAQADVIRACTGRQPPTAPAREAWVIAGRRGGKSRIAAVVAVFLATFKDYSAVLAPGERGILMLLAADRKQARVLMRYVRALLDGVPMLKKLVGSRTRDTITLKNRIDLEIHTASFRSTRGYTIVAVACDEAAYWRSEDSANPDTEVIAALRPGMATVPGSLLLCISSPHARRGALWQAYRAHWAKDGDPILVWQAPTRTMNPTVDEGVIATAYAEDEAAARADYGAQFRSDLEDYVSREVVEAAVVPGRRDLPASWSHRYHAFLDPASGTGGDSLTLAIAHVERGQAVLNCVVEHRPPFSADAAIEQVCQVLARYGIRRVVGDRFADWPRERFGPHRVAYALSELSKSEIYLGLLPLLTSHQVALLDHPRLVGQLLGLERRVGWGGKESVDHAPGAHDDVANAAAGALVHAWGARRRGLRLDVRERIRVEPADGLPVPEAAAQFPRSF